MVNPSLNMDSIGFNEFFLIIRLYGFTPTFWVGVPEKRVVVSRLKLGENNLENSILFKDFLGNSQIAI